MKIYLFKNEEHKKFSRHITPEEMALTTDNGWPLDNRDQVVLFGDGSIKTYL